MTFAVQTGNARVNSDLDLARPVGDLRHCIDEIERRQGDAERLTADDLSCVGTVPIRARAGRSTQTSWSWRRRSVNARLYARRYRRRSGRRIENVAEAKLPATRSP